MEQKEIIKAMKQIFKDNFIEDLEDIEFEYEEDGEYYYNIIADGFNFIAKLNPISEIVYWDRNLTNK